MNLPPKLYCVTAFTDSEPLLQPCISFLHPIPISTRTFVIHPIKSQTSSLALDNSTSHTARRKVAINYHEGSSRGPIRSDGELHAFLTVAPVGDIPPTALAAQMMAPVMGSSRGVLCEACMSCFASNMAVVSSPSSSLSRVRRCDAE